MLSPRLARGALDLERRGRRAPQEAGREASDRACRRLGENVPTLNGRTRLHDHPCITIGLFLLVMSVNTTSLDSDALCTIRWTRFHFKWNLGNRGMQGDQGDRRVVAARSRAVTLADVARTSGVSRATASRALNGRDRVAPDVRARVTMIARSLGYRPNTAARTLVSGRADIIGLVLPTGHIVNEPYEAHVLEAVAMSATEAGQGMMLWLAAGRAERGRPPGVPHRRRRRAGDLRRRPRRPLGRGPARRAAPVRRDRPAPGAHRRVDRRDRQRRRRAPGRRAPRRMWASAHRHDPRSRGSRRRRGPRGGVPRRPRRPRPRRRTRSCSPAASSTWRPAPRRCSNCSPTGPTPCSPPTT